MQKCVCCGEEKSEDDFSKNGRGRNRRRQCKRCRAERKKVLRARAPPEVRLAKSRRWNETVKKQRVSPEHMARYVLMEARKRDKSKGFLTTITLQDVELMLKEPCLYCGDTLMRITLDRIDNGLGYLVENVVPACIRCNYARRDMPYEAWIRYFAPAMRSARESGAFGSWIGRARRSSSSS